MIINKELIVELDKWETTTGNLTKENMLGLKVLELKNIQNDIAALEEQEKALKLELEMADLEKFKVKNYDGKTYQLTFSKTTSSRKTIDTKKIYEDYKVDIAKYTTISDVTSRRFIWTNKEKANE